MFSDVWTHRSALRFVSTARPRTPRLKQSFLMIITGEVKIATRNMFYDEQGKHRRTKKEVQTSMEISEQDTALSEKAKSMRATFHKNIPMFSHLQRCITSQIMKKTMQAENMFSRLIKEYTDRQGVTEQLKVENQLEQVGRMNNIQACVREVAENEIIQHNCDSGIFSRVPLQGGMFTSSKGGKEIENVHVFLYNC